MGSCGVGKSWLACALGYKACRENLSVLYQRVPRLFASLALGRGDGRYAKLIRQLGRVDLLILDDWGPEPLLPEQQRRAASVGAVNPLAFEEYLKGRFQMAKRTIPALEAAAAHFERATALDAGYALAHAGDPGSGVSAMFSAFSVVGIKTGQLASMFDVFGDRKIAEDLALLKDQVDPLDKPTSPVREDERRRASRGASSPGSAASSVARA